jgi:hypothetical protein
LALITCPDCGREISDLAPACPNCGRPIAAAGSRPGILPSNVGAAETRETPRARAGFPYPLVLGATLLLVLGAAGALVLTATQQRSQPAASPSTAPAATAAPTIAVNARQAAGGGGRLPDINGISCDALESTVVHIHVHLAIFVNGEEQEIPYGIGIGQPWDVADSDEGPFVTNGSCFYWIHTHTADGVVHIESPVRRRFTLGDFFGVWQIPLSATQVGPAQGQVITYINGQRDATNPPDIPLLPHARIQLDVGGDVPPYPFDFPPGD